MALRGFRRGFGPLPQSNTIRWLHISDLHMGCPGPDVWATVRLKFRDSILENRNRLPIDLILVTGDIAYKAAPREYEKFDAFLNDLRNWLRAAGQPKNKDPFIIPVPGNHDLLRPKGDGVLKYTILKELQKNPDDRYLQDLIKKIWERKNAAFFTSRFKNYMAWFGRRIVPQFQTGSLHLSHFPGDFSLDLEINGLPLTVVGLNSAWMQYDDTIGERDIELFRQQLYCALGGCDAVWDRLDNRLNLLMMHHPPSWFSAASSTRYYKEVHDPERFMICLHGHMHEGRSEAQSVNAGKMRYFFQAPSLFGLEKYGTTREDRSMGYAWGELDGAGTIHGWPYKLGDQGGRQVFHWDSQFVQDPEGGCRIRPLWDTTSEAGTVPAIDLTPWLERLLDDTGFIKISGIGSGIGLTKGAHRYDIEQLYTTLTSRGEVLATEHGEAVTTETGGAIEIGGSANLADLLTRHNLLLVEGQPGAGKTTFLHLVATVLARDLLGTPCPDGRSWRERHLGLEGGNKPRVPLFLELRRLVSLLKDNEGGDDRQRLLDLLDAKAPAFRDTPHWRAHWEGLLARGEAILLLDGLDEVADETLRDRVFTIFRDAIRTWSNCPVIVTSRPFGVEAVQGMGFYHAVIEPFGTQEIEAFIRRWVAALYERPIDCPLEGAAEEKSTLLIGAIASRPAIRRLAANPVMLTCLCVVHWNEGELPEGRARVYKAVIRWLIASRTVVRTHHGFSDPFAQEAFTKLALAMMDGAEGKKVAIIDLETAAEAVLDLTERHFPDLQDKPSRLCRMRAWLRFECLYSGILEEWAEGHIRFWHLTFQEYLAAQALAWRGDGDVPGDDWWPVLGPHLLDPQWRETVDLVPGALVDEGGPRRVDSLIRRVESLRSDAPDLAVDARVYGLLARILGPMTTAYGYKPPPGTGDTLDDLSNRVLSIFEPKGAARVQVTTRIEAAEALGQAGDPRLTGNHFIAVPGTAIALAKYPVTVWEYQQFIGEEGYHNPEWWDAEGWRTLQSKKWEVPQYWEDQVDHPNWPVAGVSWNEACAYCAWRSHESGETIRLPSEQECAKAANPDGRMYPWGAEAPESERANYGRIVGSPTPVGIYPAGDGPLGHCDLAGNVWEWQHDRIDNVGRYKERGHLRILRGGSWKLNPDDLRTVGRYWGAPGSRVDSIGFRVARTLSR